MAEKTVISVDLGAESGRVMAVKFDGKTLHLDELRRFANSPTTIDGTLYWNFLELWREIQAGLEKAKELHPASIGVDTWGVDFGLLDRNGNLLSNLVHYRDKRTDGVMERVFEKIPKETVYAQTGIQFLPFNTIFQLTSLIEQNSPLLDIAETFLTAPDLLNYWLTGIKASEFSIATTTQLYDPNSQNWSESLMDTLGIPKHLFPDIVKPGTILGKWQDIPVIAPACHDTGSAVAAIPALTPNYAYISSGTWSLVGLENAKPLISKEAMDFGLTNEGGVYDTFRLLSNIMGLWIVQQARAGWKKSGQAYSYDQLTKMASEATPLRSFIKPNDSKFLPPGDHSVTVREFCKNTAQAVPGSVGETVRCILESLALTYRDVVEKLVQLTGRQVDTIHIVGGGSKNELLNQMTADASVRPVVAGPVEATVIGNALVQLIALGEIKDIQQAREIVANMDEQRRYEPQNSDAWLEAVNRFEKL
ncbi:MAG: rhamnulokinase [Calditrichaeota bacterium]|nr:MAG: rhamnulokinase [Calditrichota bacterium]